MAQKSALSVFGIRHHGPGSARSLVASLAKMKPDCVLIEGPADGTAVLEWAAHKDTVPPVALLGYVPEKPRQGAYYPFAVFSPEWQAIRYAQKQKAHLEFIDLPFSIQFALDDIHAAEDEAKAKAEAAAQEEAGAEGDEDGDETTKVSAASSPTKPDDPLPSPRRDPLRWLAEAAGFSDGERWWEHMVEHRRGGDDVFAAILEAMSALRENIPPHDEPREAQREMLREAHMRTAIRAAKAKGHTRIAVVCGAWHAPVLTELVLDSSVATDAALLKGLKAKNASATWIPWTYGRLSSFSGYGAGVSSPGWYHHLWENDTRICEHWLTSVARMLRDEDLDASSAQTIEAVRLAETLAALRARPLPGLSELNEACQAIFCFGGVAPLQLIHTRLVVGERLGEVPDDAPMVPLQHDLLREQKRLRLKPSATQESLELDLRKENDLDRSRLFHRLNLLKVGWGETQRAGGKGTFKEVWKVQWQPEFTVALVEAGAWGNTVSGAASTFVRHRAANAQSLPELIELIGPVFLAELPDAAETVMRALRDQCALASDVTHLMRVLPPLAQLMRYGNVRQTDSEMVGEVVEGLTTRICIGLPLACGSLNEDAAGEMFGHVRATHEALTLLQIPELTDPWHSTLQRLASLPNLNGLIAGRSVRLLYDVGKLDATATGRQLSLALSVAADPAQAAAWLEGFLRDSGAVLIHDDALWGLIDDWVGQLAGEAFQSILPLLRRTFSTFQAPERRQLGERARKATAGGKRKQAAPSAAADSETLELARAERTLPVLKAILGQEG